MINRIFFFWTLSPPWSEKPFSQWLYTMIINIFTKGLLASWGGMQSNLIVFGINQLTVGDDFYK